MYPIVRFLCFVLCGVLPISICPPALASNGAIELFDGESLAGWVTAEGRPVTSGWRVEKGVLVCDGGGSIFTEAEYGDFDLRFEWKIAERGNSGLKYRVAFYQRGVFGRPGWLGCEYQLFDDKRRRSSPKTSTGSIYGLYAPSTQSSLRKAGEFNKSRIQVDGPSIKHWLNGELVVEAKVGSPDWHERIAQSKFDDVAGFFDNAKGRIQLQDHGSRVWFRQITLEKLN